MSITRASQDERRCSQKNFSLAESTLGTSTGPEGCVYRSQASQQRVQHGQCNRSHSARRIPGQSSSLDKGTATYVVFFPSGMLWDHCGGDCVTGLCRFFDNHSVFTYAHAKAICDLDRMG